MACRDVVKERGLDRITVEDLVQVNRSSVFVTKSLSPGSGSSGKSDGAGRNQEAAFEGHEELSRGAGRGLGLSTC